MREAQTTSKTLESESPTWEELESRRQTHNGIHIRVSVRDSIPSRDISPLSPSTAPVIGRTSIPLHLIHPEEFVKGLDALRSLK